MHAPPGSSESPSLELKMIEAAGHLLAYYHADLCFIRDFHRNKTGCLSDAEYLRDDQGTFCHFLKEFRVLRKVKVGASGELLQWTKRWVAGPAPEDVDGFAKQIRECGLTHGETVTSLASKILFPNNPSVILPIDQNVRKTVHLSGNAYADYLPLALDFRERYKAEIDRIFVTIGPYLAVIEDEFKSDVTNIAMIRANRYLDKLLWVCGT